MRINSANRIHKGRWIIIIVVIASFLVWYTGAAARLTGASKPSEQQRQALAEAAMANAAHSTTWPKTEPELVKAFWSAIASGDLKQATLYCPGSTESDYASYTNLKPSPEMQIGTARPHPRTKGVTLWPVQVRFSYFGSKTVKFATVKSPAGKLIIDGQNSIWW